MRGTRGRTRNVKVEIVLKGDEVATDHQDELGDDEYGPGLPVGVNSLDHVEEDR